MPDTHTSFEDLPILTELRDELWRAYTAQETNAAAARRWTVRVGRLARIGGSKRPVALAGGGTAIAAAAVAAAVLLAGPATQPAYALTENADGSVTVTIHDVETAIPALNARFAAMGIDETVVPVEPNCPTTASPSGVQDPLFAYPQATTSETLTFSPGQKNLEPGYTGVIAAEQLPDGEVAIAMEAIRPPIPSCFPTTAYTMHRTGTTANGTPIYQATPANTTATTTTTSGG